MADLVDVTSTLASTPPPAKLKFNYFPTPPAPLPAVKPTQCHACAGAAVREHFATMPQQPDRLLFADDEFVKGDPGLTQPPPYANPQNAPGATAFSGTTNILSVPGITSPQQFQTEIGAGTLGIGSGTGTFVPPTTPPTPAPVAITKKTWLPMGLTNVQALVFTTVVCTAILLLFFIVGMNSPRPVDPLLAGL